MIIDIKDIRDIKTVNDNNNYCKESINEILKDYYTADEYEKKIKMLDLMSDECSVKSRESCKLNYFRGKPMRIIILSFWSSRISDVWFFNKKDVRTLLKKIQGCVPRKAALDILKKEGFNVINHQNIGYLIDTELVYFENVFVNKQSFLKLLYGIEYFQDIVIPKTSVICKQSFEYPELLHKNYLKENFYDIKKFMVKFNLENPSFIRKQAFDSLDITYIKYDGLILFSKKEVDSLYELWKNSIKLADVVKFLNDINFHITKGVIRHRTLQDGTSYNLPFDRSCKYITKDEFEKLKTTLLNHSTLDKNYIHIKKEDVITLKQLCDLVNKAIFKGFEYFKCSGSFVSGQIRKLYMSPEFSKYRIGVKLIFSKDIVEPFIQKLRSEVKKEKIIQFMKITELEFDKLSFEEISSTYYTLDEVCSIVDDNGLMTINLRIDIYRELINSLEKANIKGFFIKGCDKFFCKKDIDIAVSYTKKLVSSKDLALLLGREVPKKYKNMAVTDISFLTRKYSWYTHESVEEILSIEKYKQMDRGCETILERFQNMVSSNRNEKEFNLPKTVAYITDYILQLKSKDLGRAIPIFEVYNLVCEVFEKEIEYMDSAEIQRMLNIVISKNLCGISTYSELLAFNNYLYTLKKSDYKEVLSKEKKPVIPYTENQFIKLMNILIDIVATPEQVEKIYGDWGKSSSLLYVFLHLFMGWRQGDLISQFPLPTPRDLGLGAMTGEEFIDWLKNGNSLGLDVCEKVTFNIEQYVESFRLKTGKTNVELYCAIPKVFCEYVALISLINWANRDMVIHNKSKYTVHNIDTNVIFFKSYIAKPRINEVFLETFKQDLSALLDGGFTSTKGAKTLLTWVATNSDEFKSLAAKRIASILRSHVNPKDESYTYSDTTFGYYVKTDTKEATILACQAGVMGSVIANVLELTDSEFSKLSRRDKGSAIANFPLTPSEVETLTESVMIRTEFIKTSLENVLTTKTKVRHFRELLVFAKSSTVGTDFKEAKCLFKILALVDGSISGIQVSQNPKCAYYRGDCLSCEYMLATKYFIYEFAKEFNNILTKIETVNTLSMKKRYIDRFKRVFMPIVLDMLNDFGVEQVRNILDIDRYTRILKNGE